MSFGGLWTGADWEKRQEAGSQGCLNAFKLSLKEPPRLIREEINLKNRDEGPVKGAHSSLVLIYLCTDLAQVNVEIDS